MEANSLCNGHYLEPYAGGAGVALELLYSGTADHVHINDADPAVFAFWIAATQYPLELLDLLEATPICIEEWLRWRAVLRGETEGTIVERGFATLYLNRTNRSGILKAGVIGGLRQEGSYKLDARFKKEVIKKRLNLVSAHAHRISVYCEDSLDLLGRCGDFLPHGSFIYLDPPYYAKGKELYRNFYNHEDHQAIANLLQHDSFGWPWLVSYDNTAEIRSLYQNSRSMIYGLNYSAQRRYVGSEVMFFSRQLQVPGEIGAKSTLDSLAS